MKKPIAIAFICALLVILGFIAGRVYQDLRNGYHHEVLEKRSYTWEVGEIQWRHEFQHVGFTPFVLPATVLEFKGRTIYKAEQGFDNGMPFADNVKASDNTVEWDDREYRFRLSVEPLPAMPPSATTSSPPPVSPP